MYLICTSAFLLMLLSAQDQEAVISKDAISVHTVERGNMPLRERAKVLISSLEPPRAVMKLAGDKAERCRPGQSVTIQINPPKVSTGKVVKGSSQDELGRCGIEFPDPLPSNTTVGQTYGALIELGEELKDVVFFSRPADSSPNSVASIFVLEPGTDFARRVTVRYGKISGPLIQVIDGISPGDRVIVTDMSKWTKYERVRLQ